MSDNKKYYYLKLKENFFDTDEMILLESMPDGYLYSNILLKLYLRSLKNDGKLMFNDRIPFNPTMLAKITRHSVGVVEKALNIFKDLELIEVLDTGAIYMLDIQNFVGKSSTEADRKRSYRSKIEEEKNKSLGQMSGQKAGQMSGQISTRDRVRDRVRDRDRDTKVSTFSEEKVCSNKLLPVVTTWNNLNLKKIVSIKPNTNRHKLLSARIKEYGLESVYQALDKIKESDFLRGQNNRGWIITFDWLIKPNNFIKVLEGNYDKKESDKDASYNKGNGNVIEDINKELFGE